MGGLDDFQSDVDFVRDGLAMTVHLSIEVAKVLFPVPEGL